MLNEDEEVTEELYPAIDAEDIVKIVMIFAFIIGVIGFARLTDLQIRQMERNIAERELPPEWSEE